jgi:dolichol kinase
MARFVLIFQRAGTDILMHVTDLSYFDVGVISLFYQFTLYVSLRLARQGFTLGELGLVSQGATALFMEVLNLTIARVLLPALTV